MKKLFSLALAVVLVFSCTLTAFATEDPTFNAGLNIQKTDEKITVIISKDNNAVLEAQKPTLTIPCEFANAYVVLVEEETREEVASTLDTAKKEISFVVAQGGKYEIINGLPSYKVSFVTGVEGVTVADQLIEKGSKAAKPEDPTREGYVLGGWFKEEDFKNPWDFEKDTVAEARSLYAKWIPVYTLKGTISNAGTCDVKVTLMASAAEEDKIEATVTNHATDATKRSYTVNAPAGSYNLVVVATSGTGESVTTTVAVVLEKNNQTLRVTLPESEVSSVVDNSKAGQYAASVNGLDNIAQNAETGVTRIVFSVEHMTNPAAAEANAITELSGPSRSMIFLNFELKKVKAGKDITMSKAPATLTIHIPMHIANKANFGVYRYHDGKAEKLTEEPDDTDVTTARDGFYQKGSDGITIYAKKFSTYAIGYTADTVAPSIKSVTVTPEEAELKHGESQDFTAVVVDEKDLNTSVRWKLTGRTDDTTTITDQGKLTVGIKEMAKELTVTAISNADNSKSDTAKVTVKARYKFTTTTTTNYTWIKNKNTNLRFKTDGKANELEALEIYDKDGNKIEVDYTVTGTSTTTITVKSADLKKKDLASGTYTILAVYDDGSAIGQITVQKTATNSKTGDAFNPVLWVSLMAVCAGAAVVLVILKKKNDKK